MEGNLCINNGKSPRMARHQGAMFLWTWDYTFTYAVPANGSYTNNAAPVTLHSTGVRYFFTDQTVVIRANAGAATTAASTPI